MSAGKPNSCRIHATVEGKNVEHVLLNSV